MTRRSTARGSPKNGVSSLSTRPATIWALPLRQVAAALADLGYRYSDGAVVDEHAVRTHERSVYEVLLDVSPAPDVGREQRRIGPVAAALARAALGTTPPT